MDREQHTGRALKYRGQDWTYFQVSAAGHFFDFANWGWVHCCKVWQHEHPSNNKRLHNAGRESTQNRCIDRRDRARELIKSRFRNFAPFGSKVVRCRIKIPADWWFKGNHAWGGRYLFPKSGISWHFKGRGKHQIAVQWTAAHAVLPVVGHRGFVWRCKQDSRTTQCER